MGAQFRGDGRKLPLVAAHLEGRFPEAAGLLDEAGPRSFAFTTSFRKEHRRQLWSNSSLERVG